MDEGDLAVLLYRAVHAPQRPTVELDIEHDRDAEAALRAHAADGLRRLTHGLAVGGFATEAGDPDVVVRDPQWLFGDFRWEIGEPAEALGRPAMRVTAVPETPMPVGREHFLDRIELLVDAGTGLLLRLVEIHDGRPVRTVAVRAVGAEAARPEPPSPPPGAGPEASLPSSMGADQVGAAVRTGVLTLARMAFDPSLRRLLRGGAGPDLTPEEFTRSEPVPLDETPPSVEEVVRLLALARPAGLAGAWRSQFADGRFALPDDRRFRLDFTRTSGPAAALAEAFDGERHYRLMPDRLVVDPGPPHFFLGPLRRPRAVLREPLAVRDVVDWKGRRALRLTIGGSTVVVDAETGLVLANEYLELHDLGPAPQQPEHYRLQAPEGIPVVESDGGPLGDALLAPPVRAGLEGAARAIGGLAEGVARLLGR
ncbi:hypothetical protein [Streptacidiphilus anmyonensis]|uniref:hypothetical protein n=1 Tax=Streptacidiphilus anmyonensis TaxID=405782 RepID=UPI0005AB4129|nr:hypothetical protein [Streptacidiphilus anmyonensis]